VDEGIEGADEFRSERRRATAAAATGAVLGAHQSASAVPPSSSAVSSAIGPAARRELGRVGSRRGAVSGAARCEELAE